MSQHATDHPARPGLTQEIRTLELRLQTLKRLETTSKFTGTDDTVVVALETPMAQHFAERKAADVTRKRRAKLAQLKSQESNLAKRERRLLARAKETRAELENVECKIRRLTELGA